MTNTFKRTSTNWIQTVTGRKFWPLSPRVEDVCIEDIAHALSLKCRFTGHTLEFYSVAQHSILASHMVPPPDALWALLHDATEAYLPDVARPVKKELEGFDAIEEQLARCIARRFHLWWPMPESVARADLMLLATEFRDLMAPAPDAWRSLEGVEPLNQTIVPLPPAEVREMFLQRFEELWHG